MELSKERWLEIGKLLPNIPDTQKRVITLSPSMVALVTGPHSRLDVACVCLQDACDVACDAVYALTQAHANLAWFREDISDAPNELGAIIKSRFYIDDIALRLYAAAEHTANFIICYLNIGKDDLEPYEKKHSSLQQRVGRYVLNEYPTHEISSYIQALVAEESWKNTMRYRNTWVHEQPPLIDNVGIVSKRRARWSKNGNIYKLGFTSSDPPEYTVDQLLQMTSLATHAFGNMLEKLTSMFICFLEDSGITFKEDSDKISMTL
ncbi:MAG: hypothetical protein H6662_06585 [Ardenticatenaceae bacterium]|nr:hypothetical protein [Ardenticatenaceae bacterium]MCB8990597.1 hypothetical protein [Ardenticatenaceae bacterium]MCB9004304.1 hypothetical protein [Ardenticatenaceae bacterium]